MNSGHRYFSQNRSTMAESARSAQCCAELDGIDHLSDDGGDDDDDDDNDNDNDDHRCRRDDYDGDEMTTRDYDGGGDDDEMTKMALTQKIILIHVIRIFFSH